MTNTDNISQEAKTFAGMNERFDSEKIEVQTIRKEFAMTYDLFLVNSEIMDERLREIAITNLETSLMFAIKAIYEGENNI